MAKIRPLNYFLPSQTAGYFFQLAGIVANTVHGGIYESGFIYEYVTRMRVMLHDGSIKVIDDEKDLRFWRTSFGLLGLIIGLEFELVQRPKLQVYTVPERELANWSEAEFWRYINVDAAANVPPSTPGLAAPTGFQAAASGEFFLNFGLDDLLGSSMLCVATRTGENATLPGIPTDAPADVVAQYEKLMQHMVVVKDDGLEPYGTAARKMGAPPLQFSVEAGNSSFSIALGPGGLPVPLNVLLEDAGTFLEGDSIPLDLLSRGLSAASLQQAPGLMEYLRKRVNDGFWLTESPAALISAWFLTPDKAFQAMDFLRSQQHASLKRQKQGENHFIWNQPAEFRFLTVGDKAELQVVSPGLHFNSEFLSFPDVSGDSQSWKRAFKKVQKILGG
ncbi:unnamed protein product [Polarella glacialis]|uniref:Uncharacterized protein n=1 Tax=Polarella glacialis TaxID=89957 RepID=A0A813HBZ2_POLGL|nr:unnamed protein product [Polarella glacialis]